MIFVGVANMRLIDYQWISSIAFHIYKQSPTESQIIRKKEFELGKFPM